MHTVITASAGEIVAALAAEIDLPSWPDPVRTWYSSSAPETHPGKRYHQGVYCRRLVSVVSVQEYQYTVAQVGDRRCTDCWNHGDNAGVNRYKLQRFIDELAEFAAQVDAGTAQDQVAASLARAARQWMGSQAPETKRAGQLSTDAVARVLTLRASARPCDEGDTAVNAAMLLQAETSVDPVRGGASKVPPIGPVSTLMSSSELVSGWAAFCDALRSGESVDAATSAAVGALLPLRRSAYSVNQLAGLSVSATEGQVVSVSDLVALWAVAAEAHVREVVACWATQTREMISLGESAGAMRVSILNDYSRPDDRARVQDHYASRYPSRITRDAVIVDVPAVSAEFLRRNFGAKLEPSESYPESSLTVAQRLIEEGLRPLDAYAAARVVDTQHAHM